MNIKSCVCDFSNNKGAVMLNMGLEALKTNNDDMFVADVEQCLFGTVDTLDRLASIEAEFVCFDQCMIGYENLLEIVAHINEHGTSPAIESLFGQVDVSCEGLGDALKKVGEFIKGIWEKIKAFFASIFGNADSMIKNLQVRAKELSNASGMTAVELSLKEEKIKKLAELLKKQFEDGFKKGVELLEKMAAAIGKSDNSAAEELKKHLEMAKAGKEECDKVIKEAEGATYKLEDPKIAAGICLAVAACIEVCKLAKPLVDRADGIVKRMIDNDVLSTVSKVAEGVEGEGKGLSADELSSMKEVLNVLKEYTAYARSLSGQNIRYSMMAGSFCLSKFKATK